MDSREIAKRLGILSIEERMQIIKSLLEAGPDGMLMAEIAAVTELGVPAVYKQMEALLGSEMVTFRPVGSDKVYSVNTKLLAELFDHMYHHFGPGFVPAPKVIEIEEE